MLISSIKSFFVRSLSWTNRSKALSRSWARMLTPQMSLSSWDLPPMTHPTKRRSMKRTGWSYIFSWSEMSASTSQHPSLRPSVKKCWKVSTFLNTTSLTESCYTRISSPRRPKRSNSNFSSRLLRRSRPISCKHLCLPITSITWPRCCEAVTIMVYSVTIHIITDWFRKEKSWRSLVKQSRRCSRMAQSSTRTTVNCLPNDRPKTVSSSFRASWAITLSMDKILWVYFNLTFWVPLSTSTTVVLKR